jgi:hypothetical protein
VVITGYCARRTLRGSEMRRGIVSKI